MGTYLSIVLIYTILSISYITYELCRGNYRTNFRINLIIGFIFGYIWTNFQFENIISGCAIFFSSLAGIFGAITFMYILGRKQIKIDKHSFTIDELLKSRGVIISKIDDNVYLCKLDDEDETNIIVHIDNIDNNEDVIDKNFMITSIEKSNINGKII